jgi:hypothetical protein
LVRLPTDYLHFFDIPKSLPSKMTPYFHRYLMAFDAEWDASLVFINTLMIQRVLTYAPWSNTLGARDLAALNPKLDTLDHKNIDKSMG